MAMQTFSESLPMLLYGALDTVMPPFRTIFKQYGLTEQQWRVLRVLWEGDGIGTRELSRLTLISPPSLVGVVDRMIAMELITRERSVADRRAVHIELTASGRMLQREVMPQVEAAYAELQGAVAPDLWDALTQGLRLLADRRTASITE